MGFVVDAFTGRKAQKEQTRSADRAGQMQREMFDATRADINRRQDEWIAKSNEFAESYQPFINVGQQASDLTAALSGSMGPEAQAQAIAQYQESPGVAFQREQGMRGLEQNLTASGVGGGTRLKELSRFNQGLALQDFNNQYNRLAKQSDIGRAALSDSVQNRLQALSGGVSAASNIGKLGEQTAAQTGSLEIAKGRAYADRFNKLGDSVAQGVNVVGSILSGGAF